MEYFGKFKGNSLVFIVCQSYQFRAGILKNKFCCMYHEQGKTQLKSIL